MDNFDTKSFLANSYGEIQERNKCCMEYLHRMFSTVIGEREEQELTVLDIGCGPVIQNSISAARFASKIAFADKFHSNRDSIQKWLDKDVNAFNWSPFFDYAVKTLEGKDEKEAREREERMRQISKVVFCDALSETIIDKGYRGPYDVILQVGCLEAACPNKLSYETCMKRLTKLLKPGGVMFHCATNAIEDIEDYCYRVGVEDHHCLCLTADYVASIFQLCNFKNIQSVILHQEPREFYKETFGKIANGIHVVYGTLQ